MSIAINSSVPLVAIQGATADVVLQPGTVITALVQQVLGNDQVQISIGGQSLQVTSQVPLQAGQTLQLSVSQANNGTVQLAVVNQQANTTASSSASQGLAASQTVAGNQGLANLVTTLAISDAAILATGTIAPSNTPVTPSNQLTALQAIAVSAAAQTAATQQASLAPLFANLDAATGLGGLPQQVQQAAAAVLAQRVSPDQGLTGADIKQAFQSSGLFLEASLASGTLSSSAATPDLKAALIVLRQVLTTSLGSIATTPAATSATTPTTAPQITAAATTGQGSAAPAIVVGEPGAEQLLQVSPSALTITAAADVPATASPALAPLLASGIVAGANLSESAATAIPQAVLEFSAANAALSLAATPADAAARTAASSAALNVLQEVVQANPLAGPLSAGTLTGLLANDGLMLSLLPAVAGLRLPNVDDAAFTRTNVPPPPVGGALPAAQPVMPATLSGNSSPETTMHHLLSDTDSAIARQTLLQVASLPDQVDTSTGRLDPTVPRWNFEIPFVTSQGTAMAQFEISRDGGGSEKDAQRVWRARFSLDVEPAGPVHALVSLSGERTSVRMWAERPATADQMRAGVTQLSQALSRAELVPGDIVIRDGAPSQPAAARAGHFLDRAL
jgi:Flagellar hook-length control protein FliK